MGTMKSIARNVLIEIRKNNLEHILTKIHRRRENIIIFLKNVKIKSKNRFVY